MKTTTTPELKTKQKTKTTPELKLKTKLKALRDEGADSLSGGVCQGSPGT